MDNQPADDKNASGKFTDGNLVLGGKKPPFYNVIYWVLVGVSISGITWLFRSGAVQLWDRHRSAGEDYQYGWGVSLLFAIPSGFILGSLLMFQFLMWHQYRYKKLDKK